MVNAAYNILFDKVKIGPLTAKNRFYQVPHCCGYGHLRPKAHAAMRAIKAEGGWAVVSTEETEIHPSSDLSPYSEQRLWDEKDAKALTLMTEKVHEHGALAAVELAHNGHHSPNLFSRIPPLSPSGRSLDIIYPKQARAMDKTDIKNLRQWHKNAAINAKNAGFDIIYVYAGHRMSLPHQFMIKEYNERIDEYGGSLENRIRLTKELLEDTKEAVGDTCAVAFRFAVDELKGEDGMQASIEGKEVVEMLANYPDLWDVNVSDWSNDSITTRYDKNEAFQLNYTAFVKEVTQKPVVGVGRITSPDKMVSLIKNKYLDFIGAARPSIADPFIPHKVLHDEIDDIRECIGCNICVSSDNLGVPIRCTQNPTMGEEWRRKWHPEKAEHKKTDKHVFIIGSGPSGLECAHHLGKRGYQVTLAEKNNYLVAGLLKEASLLGLETYKYVIDYRLNQLQKMANVTLYTDSDVDDAMIEELQADFTFVATGAVWRRDGVGKTSRAKLVPPSSINIFTPDDIMANVTLPAGPIVIYDDEHGYIGGVLAEHLYQTRQDIHFITSAESISPWTINTLEFERVQQSLYQKNIVINLLSSLTAIFDNTIEIAHHYSGAKQHIACTNLILITEKTPIMPVTIHDNMKVIGDAFCAWPYC